MQNSNTLLKEVIESSITFNKSKQYNVSFVCDIRNLDGTTILYNNKNDTFWGEDLVWYGDLDFNKINRVNVNGYSKSTGLPFILWSVVLWHNSDENSKEPCFYLSNKTRNKIYKIDNIKRYQYSSASGGYITKEDNIELLKTSSNSSSHGTMMEPYYFSMVEMMNQNITNSPTQSPTKVITLSPTQSPSQQPTNNSNLISELITNDIHFNKSKQYNLSFLCNVNKSDGSTIEYTDSNNSFWNSNLKWLGDLDEDKENRILSNGFSKVSGLPFILWTVVLWHNSDENNRIPNLILQNLDDNSVYVINSIKELEYNTSTNSYLAKEIHIENLNKTTSVSSSHGNIMNPYYLELVEYNGNLTTISDTPSPTCVHTLAPTSSPTCSPSHLITDSPTSSPTSTPTSTPTQAITQTLTNPITPSPSQLVLNESNPLGDYIHDSITFNKSKQYNITLVCTIHQADGNKVDFSNVNHTFWNNNLQWLGDLDKDRLNRINSNGYSRINGAPYVIWSLVLWHNSDENNRMPRFYLFDRDNGKVYRTHKVCKLNYNTTSNSYDITQKNVSYNLTESVSSSHGNLLEPYYIDFVEYTGPTPSPTGSPTQSPTSSPTATPTSTPTATPTQSPTGTPTQSPTSTPTATPTASPTSTPTQSPTGTPTSSPTQSPTGTPTQSPTSTPTATPTQSPTGTPTQSPTSTPTATPTQSPTSTPTSSPTQSPTGTPTQSPTGSPTETPTQSPTGTPTQSPTNWHKAMKGLNILEKIDISNVNLNTEIVTLIKYFVNKELKEQVLSVNPTIDSATLDNMLPYLGDKLIDHIYEEDGEMTTNQELFTNPGITVNEVVKNIENLL